MVSLSDQTRFMGKQSDFKRSGLPIQAIMDQIRIPWTQYILNNKGYNPIGDEAIPHLRSFPQLKTLWLPNCGLTAKGVEAISEISFAPHLEGICLGRIVDSIGINKIGDDGVRQLSRFNSLI